ncbi:MAG: WD40/YVTN/BNR-like repeat-containing protein [Oleiphilus sp.]
MKILTNKFKTGLLSLIGAGLIHGQVFAVEDVLNTPSVKTELAKEKLLLDITKSGDRLVSVGYRGHVIYSDDAGNSWTQANVPVSVLLNAVSFVDDSYGWAVGHSGVVLNTVDGGKNWSAQFDGNAANKMVITQAENRVVRLTEELEQAPEEEQGDLEYDVEDATFALEDARLDAEVGASKPFLDVLFSSRSEGFAVGAYGYFFKTKDGGETWENYGTRISNPDRFHLNAINRVKGGNLFIVGEAGVIFRSKDAGETWETIESPYQGSFFGVTGTHERDVVIAFGLRGHLYRSQNSGDTWKRVETGSEGTLMSAAVSSEGDITVVGNSGTVLFSKDGGRSFSEIIREDRLSNTSAVYIGTDKVAMVGENGFNIAKPTGSDF